MADNVLEASSNLLASLADTLGRGRRTVIMETVQTTYSPVRPTAAPRRVKGLPKIMLVAYRLVLEIMARLPVVGGMVVLRSFLTPPRNPSRLTDENRALWQRATRHSIRVGRTTCPLYQWTPPRTSRGHAVVCHGWADAAPSMLPIIRALLDRGFTVWAPEAPAHGRSAGRQSSLPDFIRTVHAALEHIGPVDVVVGHSFGAAAIGMAVTGYPPFGPVRNVGGVVLISSPHHHRAYPNFLFDSSVSAIPFVENCTRNLTIALGPSKRSAPSALKWPPWRVL